MGMDLRTGELKELDPDSPLLKDLLTAKDRLVGAMNRAIPERDAQGPIFSTGAEVTVTDERGVSGKFRVHAIVGNRLYLDGIPSL